MRIYIISTIICLIGIVSSGFLITRPIEFTKTNMRESISVEPKQKYAYAYWNDERGKQTTLNGTRFTIRKFSQVYKLDVAKFGTIYSVKKRDTIRLYHILLAKFNINGLCNRRPYINISESKFHDKKLLCRMARQTFGISEEMWDVCFAL